MSFFDKLLDAAAVATTVAVGVMAAMSLATPAGLVIAAIVLTLASGVNNYIDAKEAAKELQRKTEGILANKLTAGGRIPIIYGSRRVGAQIVYMDTAANENKDLFVVYALGVGEIESINPYTIKIDGTLITNAIRFHDGWYVGQDKITSGSGSLNTADNTGAITSTVRGGTDPTAKYRMVFNLHHGAATQTADPMLVASLGSKWGSNHKLNGIAYIAAKYRYDTGGMFRQVPSLTVEVQGKKVFDPRDAGQTFGNVSTYKWSNNPALTFLDYITNDEYGKGLPIAKINTSTFSTAANTADATNNNPDFNGNEAAVAWSGTSGESSAFIDNFSDWRKFKVGEKITLKDNGGNTIVNNRIITELLKYKHPFATTNEYVVTWDSQHPLTQNYDIDGTVVNAISNSPRFHCNGVLDPDQNIIENATELLACMRGIFNYIDGKYELQIEDVGSSTFSINDSHILGDSGISVSYGNKDAKANKVIVEYVNGQNNFEPDTATVLHSASPNHTSDDGDEELEITAQFPHITSPYIAYNMGKAILTRSRNQTAVTFTGTPEIYKLNVGDIVDVTYAGLGFSGKVFRVQTLELQPNGFVNVSLLEYFDVYSWTVPPQQGVNDVINTPDKFAVKAPTNLAFTDTNSSGTGRPFISWDIPTDFAYYQYRINIVDSSSNQVINRIVDKHFTDLNFLPIGTNYVASVSALNSVGTESTPATLTFSIGDKPIKTNDLQDGTVTTVTIADSTGSSDGVTTSKLADDAVSTIKIAADAVTAAKIQANTITATEISSNTITASEIAAGTLTSASGVFGAISAGDITTGSLDVSRITDDSLVIYDKGTAGTVGSTSAAGGSEVTLDGTSHTNSVYVGQASTYFSNFYGSAPYQKYGSTVLSSTSNLSFNPVNNGSFLVEIIITHDGQLGGSNIQSWLDVYTITENTGSYDTATDTSSSTLVAQGFQHRRVATAPLLTSVFRFILTATAGKYYYVRTYSGANDVFFLGATAATLANGRCITTPSISITGLFL